MSNTKLNCCKCGKELGLGTKVTSDGVLWKCEDCLQKENSFVGLLHKEMDELIDDYAKRRISDLEAKLAESNESHHKNIVELTKIATEKDRKIEELKQQLAEKEKEIECLRTRQFIDMTEKEMLELKIATHNEDLKKIKHIFDQDKISFAVGQLEKVKELLWDSINDETPYGDVIGVREEIDNQIKQLKEMK